MMFLIADLAIPMAIDPNLRAFDFAPFYCAGEAVAQGADPYRAMPLGACEHRVATGPFFGSGVVMPAPLPPYALAGLRVVAFMPFGAAQHLLDWASLGSFAVSAFLLGKLTRAPMMVIVFAIAPIAWVVLALGQTLLVMLCALMVCAALIERGHDGWAALVASALMVEPHVGIAVCASLFLWRAKTRPVFLATGTVLGTIAVTMLSWPVVGEYFTAVLPLHARSEVYAAARFSLTSALVGLGVPVAAALKLGALQYAIGLIVGVFVARSLEDRLGAKSALAIVPPLFAVVGGTFMHATDFILAVPAALLIATNTTRAAWATAAMVAIAAHFAWDAWQTFYPISTTPFAPVEIHLRTLFMDGPFTAVVLVMLVMGMQVEGAALARELQAEAENGAGAVHPLEVPVLTRPYRRLEARLRALSRGGPRAYLRLARLQVAQLDLAMERWHRERSEIEEPLEAEEQLRRHVLALRR